MLHPSHPLPIEPFKRLQVSDGLLLTAERWRVAHDYHRQRQNVHYQSLNQAGIVAGLGVCVIPPPESIAREYQDGRWLQIQQGVAIDGFGNPIVVPEPIAFRVASPAPIQGTLTVYIILRYVDPERLQGQGDRDLVQETFRIDEISQEPTSKEVELCRVVLQPGEVKLISATDVLHPIANMLDLRFRQIAQARPVQQVCVAQVLSKTIRAVDSAVDQRLQSLLRSLPALYPTMQGVVSAPVDLMQAHAASDGADLLYLSHSQFLTLTAAEQQVLQAYLTTGTVLLIEASAQESSIGELSLIRHQLQTVIATVAQEPNSIEVRRDLEAERVAIETALNQELQTIKISLQAIVPTIQEHDPEVGSGIISSTHPLRHDPFLFAQFPIVETCPVQLFSWDGIILSIGSLSAAWEVDAELLVSRETIRTAQEMGINLLHFSWRRRQLTQLQQPPLASTLV